MTGPNGEGLTVHEETFTVVGFWAETQERYADKYTAASAVMAEELAAMYAREQGGHLLVCAVFDGDVVSRDGYARWLDPNARTQEQQDQSWREITEGQEW